MNRDCIIVTGASRGIGAAIAIALAQQGREVICLSRSGASPKGMDVTPELARRFHSIKSAVTNADAMKTAMLTVANEGWNIKGLVNNAGLHIDAASADVALDEWNQIMGTNATSVVIASQAAYPYMVKAQGGLIVNIGSFFDKLGVKRNLAYCASKAAVGAITRVLAVEWASKGIRCMNVAPGYIVTDLNLDAMAPDGPLRAYLDKRIPGKEPGKAADVGALVASLFTPAGAFLNGETIYMDGAQSIAH